MNKKFKIIIFLLGILPFLYLLFVYSSFFFRIDDRLRIKQETIRFHKNTVEYNSTVDKILEKNPVEYCGKSRNRTQTYVENYGVIINCVPEYKNHEEDLDTGMYIIFPSWWQPAAGSMGGCFTGLFWSNAKVPGSYVMRQETSGVPIIKKITQNWYAFSYVSISECNSKNKHLIF